MKKTITTQQLTSDEEKQIFVVLTQFISWLRAKKMVSNMPSIRYMDLPSADADWVMKFDPVTGDISFNTFCRKHCSFEYFQSIVIHEFFHLAVQKVPSKEDATRVKDDFGEQLMKLIDIEADFFTALFYKEILGYSLVGYLKLYHEGSKVFKDKWIRMGKLERFIGTLLSISKMFINHPTNAKKVSSYDLYLVAISPLFTEDNLHVLVIRNEHIYFDLIHASAADFVKIKECYTNDDGFSLKGYVDRIVAFITKALSITIPESITKEIARL